MKISNITEWVIISISGLIGALIFFNIQTLLLKYIDEFEIFHFDTIAYSGILIGFTLLTISKILKKLELKKFPNFLIGIIFSVICLGVLAILYTVGDNTILSGILLILFFAISIFLGSDIFSRLNFHVFNKIKSIVGAVLGGIISGIFISLVFVLKINFSIDEGFFLLTIFSLMLFGGIIGGTIFITVSIWNLISKKRVNLFTKTQMISSKKKISIVSLIGISLFFITAFTYWDTFNLNDETVLYSANESKLFSICGDLGNEIESRPFLYDKEKIIEFLKSKPGPNIDIIFYLYYLSNDNEYESKFKELLLDEVKNKKFVGISNSVKAWQFQAMHRAYYYDLAIEKNEELFTTAETKLILDWFKEINEQVYEITWVSYAYGFINKKLPEGPYENQEIGIGLLSILSEILHEK